MMVRFHFAKHIFNGSNRLILFSFIIYNATKTYFSIESMMNEKKMENLKQIEPNSLAVLKMNSIGELL